MGEPIRNRHDLERVAGFMGRGQVNKGLAAILDSIPEAVHSDLGRLAVYALSYPYRYAWLDVATALLERDASIPEAHALMALALFKRGDFDGASGQARTALDLDPQNQEGRIASAWCRSRLEPGSAILPSLYESDGSDSARLQETRVRFMVGWDTPGNALAMAQDLAIRPGATWSGILTYGALLTRVNRIEEALEFIWRSLGMQSGSAEAREQYALALLRSGDKARALEHARVAAQLNATTCHTYGVLARAYTENRQMAHARQAYSYGLQLDPTEPSLLRGWGYLELNQCRFPRGLELLRSAEREAARRGGGYRYKKELGIRVMVIGASVGAVIAGFMLLKNSNPLGFAVLLPLELAMILGAIRKTGDRQAVRRSVIVVLVVLVLEVLAFL